MKMRATEVSFAVGSVQAAGISMEASGRDQPLPLPAGQLLAVFELPVEQGVVAVRQPHDVQLRRIRGTISIWR